MSSQTARPTVLIIQPSIQHYRVPVFDRLRDVADSEFSVEVCGEMSNGQAIGGGKRSYFHDYPLRKFYLGNRPIVWWPGIIKNIKFERPDAVISTAYPSNVTSWILPQACKSVGAAAIGRTKVQSPNPSSIAQHIKRKLFRRYDYILAYSGPSLDELVRLAYPSKNVFVTNNTVDTDRLFSDKQRFITEPNTLRAQHELKDKCVLLWISKMEKHKRQHDLLDAWPQLRKLNSHLHLVLIGSGSLSDQIRRRAESLDAQRIHFLGRVTSGMDYNWICASDATIQCGGIGLAINQSMAFGKPTIISDEIGPDTDSLVDRQTGFGYQKGNQDDLVEEVKLALSNDRLVEKVTVDAQSVIRQHYSIDHMVSQIRSCPRSAFRSQKQSS